MELIFIAGVVVIVVAILFPGFFREIIGMLVFGAIISYLSKKIGFAGIGICIFGLIVLCFVVEKFLRAPVNKED